MDNELQEYEVEVVYGGVINFTVEAESEEEAQSLAYDEAMMEVPMEAEIDSISVF